MISNQSASSASLRPSRKEALLPARRKNNGCEKENQSKILSRASPSSKTPPSASTRVRRLKKGPKRETVALTKSHETRIQKNAIALVGRKKDGVSPASKKRHERQNRPSFQGLTVVDGKSKDSSSAIVQEQGVEEKKRERRRRSLDLMKCSAQSDQIRQMLESTVDDMSVYSVDGTAEERLQAIMTKAKERGMTTDNIFNFFNGGNPNTAYITKESFLTSLEKLGDTFLVITDEELTKIVKKFDKNNDEKISLVEFKNYCYTEIQSIAWKAERHRLEKNGEMEKLRKQLCRRFTIRIDNKPDEHSCGEEVLRASKLFWRTENTVEIRLFYAKSLDVITVQLYSQKSGKELPCIYVCKNKIEYQNSHAGDGSKERDEDSCGQQSWEDIGKYLVNRLKLKECQGEIEEEKVPELECSHISKKASCIPFLSKLTGDTFDTLMIQKPLNLDPPPPITSSSTVANDFEEKIASLRTESRKARSSRQSAQGLTNLVDSVLSEVQKTNKLEIGSRVSRGSQGSLADILASAMSEVQCMQQEEERASS